MTEDSHGWGGPEPAATVPTASAPPGWYPDPWSSGHHRYWDGNTWTSGYFPNGPAVPWADEGADAAQSSWATSGSPVASDTAVMPPAEWSPQSSYLNWGTAAPTQPGFTPPGPPTETGAKPSRLPSGPAFVALIVGIMLVVGALGAVGGYYAFRHHNTTSASGSTSPTTSGSAPSGPTDPAASTLQSLVLNQSDVPSTVVVQPIQGGNQVSGEATLDLCNGTFPSESLRTARLQVAAYDGTGNVLLSTEAVLYKNPAATQQAFAELKSVAAACPSTPVVSPVGEATITTQFNAPPDTTWPQTPTVTRQAYDFMTTDELGTAQHSVAVYLRRGRVLMGLYFSQPDSAQPAVTGKTTIQDIAAVFATRIANLPASVVNG